jgi:hypothetical protein
MALTTTDGSKTLYTYFPEAVAGTPAAGAYQTLRSKVGVKFDLKRDTFMSKERRSDRQESSMSYGNVSGSGSIPIEWSYGSFDDLMAAVMGGAWTSEVLKIGNVVNTFTFEETATELGIVEQNLGAQFSGFSISQKVNSIAEGSLDFIYRNTQAAQTKGVNIAIDATAKTITRASAGFNTVDGFPLVTAGVPLLKVWMKGNTDAGNNDTVWTVTTLTDTVMSFTTMTGSVTKTTTAGIVVNLASNSTSVVAPATTAPFDSFTGTITEGGAVIAHVTGWDLKVGQAVQPNFACGSAAAQSVSVGTLKVSGNLTVYYIDQALRKKFINGTGSSLSLVLGSVAATKAYTLDLGTVKYTSNTRDDAELARTESLAFAATYTVTDTALKITRTP